MDIKGVSWSIFSFPSAVLPAFDNWLQNLNPFPWGDVYKSSWFIISWRLGGNAWGFIFSSKFWGKFGIPLLVSGVATWGLISFGIVVRERVYTPFSICLFGYFWGFIPKLFCFDTENWVFAFFIIDSLLSILISFVDLFDLWEEDIEFSSKLFFNGLIV